MEITGHPAQLLLTNSDAKTAQSPPDPVGFAF
jgi:hypothetical protein